MYSYIRLSRIIINTRYINRIDIDTSSYSIHLMNTHNGWLSGCSLLFFGYSSSHKIINVYSEEKDDYKIITDYIQEVSQKK